MTRLSMGDRAIGRRRRGDGLDGMSRAFMRAGVPNLVATLWPVKGSPGLGNTMTSAYHKAQILDMRSGIAEWYHERFMRGVATLFESSPIFSRSRKLIANVSNDNRRNPL